MSSLVKHNLVYYLPWFRCRYPWTALYLWRVFCFHSTIFTLPCHILMSRSILFTYISFDLMMSKHNNYCTAERSVHSISNVVWVRRLHYPVTILICTNNILYIHCSLYNLLPFSKEALYRVTI